MKNLHPISLSFFRSLVEDSHFSPLIDLEKNDSTGLLRFTDHICSGQRISAKRIESLEKNLVKYFRTRDEDNIKKPIPTINTTVMTTRPTTASSHDVFRSNDDLSTRMDESINSSFWNYPFGYQTNRNETVY
jgi:hypothetical protein